MNVDNLKSNINATMVFAKSVALHPNASAVEVVFRTADGVIETTLGDMANKVCEMWEEFNLDNDEGEVKNA